MRTYKCWVDGRKETTTQVIQAENSFIARTRVATQNGVKVFEVVAVWQRDAAAS